MIKILDIASRESIDGPSMVAKSVASRLPRRFQVYFHGDFFNSSDSNLSKMWKIGVKLLDYHFDIIHTRAWQVCISLRRLVKLRNPKSKHVFTAHGFPFEKPGYSAGRWLSKDADIVHCVSKFTSMEVKKAYGVDSRVIYNGVDPKSIKPKAHYNARVKILFVGSYVELKKPQYVARLAKEFPQCDFEMYGAHVNTQIRKKLDEISRKIPNLCVSDPIHHDDLIKVYQNADIFLFPSVHEGLPNAVLEAMATGLPVVGFNAHSMPELVEHGKSGLLSDLVFEKGDMRDLKSFNFSRVDLSLKKMRDHLQYLIEDENVRKSFSRSVREISLQIDWDKIVKQYADMYKEVAHG